MKYKKLVILTLVLTLLISACSPSSLNLPEEANTAEQEDLGSPQSGGTINLATTSTLNLNPLLANDDETMAILSLIFEWPCKNRRTRHGATCSC